MTHLSIHMHIGRIANICRGGLLAIRDMTGGLLGPELRSVLCLHQRPNSYPL